MMFRRCALILLIGLVAGGLLAASMPGAEAGLLGKLLREAGEGAGDAGKKAGKLDGANLPDGLGGILTNLPEASRGRSLIAETTPEGHLRLTNAKGETVTAATSTELNAALKWLLPEASDLGRANVDFYVPAETLIKNRDALKTLLRNARLRVAYKSRSYSVLGSPPFADGPMRVRLRDNLIARIDSDTALGEAVWQAGRALKATALRVLTLDPDGPSAVPRIRTGTDGKALPAESVNPYAFRKSLGNLQGQTAVLTGQIDGDLLYFTPPSGKKQSVLVSDLQTAARRDDVNLVILDADSPRQPGVRNLFWQKTDVAGLERALEKATMGDFLDALGSGRGPLELSISGNGGTHVAMKAMPQPNLARQMPGRDNSVLTTTESVLSEILSSATGNVIATGVDAVMRSEAHDRELRNRIIPGIPSTIQIVYVLLLLAGVFGLPMATAWWRKIWPLRDRASFGSTLGLIGDRVLRFFPFAFVFLPLVALPAAAWQLLVAPLALITAPFRWLMRRGAA